jgi:transformation/transcription domain-associated protein
VLRICYRTLLKRIDSRRNNLRFHTPTAVHLRQDLRLIESSASLITLEDVFESHCQENRIGSHEVTLSQLNKLRDLIEYKRSLGVSFAVLK